MKPVSPFSSPSSCNVNENLSCSNGKTAGGCISRILRRILCFSSLPLCSFDHFKEDEKESSLVIGASGSTAGLVARLMGLESFPSVETIEESPLISCADSFKKSRSTQMRRRRIIPAAYLELEDDKFFILSFEKEGRRYESQVERRKSGKNSERMEQSIGSKCKKNSMKRRECLQGRNKENEEANIVPTGNLDSGIRDDFQVENPGSALFPLKNPCQKSQKKPWKRKANGDDSMAAISFETEGDSENSSPNSVLEFMEFPIEQESASPGEVSRLANSKMRRPLSEELENCGNSREKKLISNGDGEKERPTCRLHNYAEEWDEIRELAAMETTKSSWVHDEISKNQHCFMEISRDLESNILDQLLDELLSNLDEFSLETL